VNGIRRFQLVQGQPGQVRVIAVVAPDADRDAIRSRILDDVGRLEDSIEAGVEFADSLPRTEGGKVRTVLTHEASAE